MLITLRLTYEILFFSQACELLRPSRLQVVSTNQLFDYVIIDFVRVFRQVEDALTNSNALGDVFASAKPKT